METEINIVEILNDKPQGTKLYSSACGKCNLEEVDDKSFKISFYNSKFGFMNGGEGYLDKNGKLYDDGECVVFPSKEMRNWSKFAWKKGDVLVSNDGKCKVIFERFDDDTYTSFVGKYYVECYGKNDELQDYEEEHYGDTVNYTKESEEAAQTYINTIEERLGGKLNHETLEIENAQPEFKDGDIAFADYGNRQDVFIVSDKTDLSEGYSSFISLDLNILTLSMGCRTTFFKKDICKLRLATEAEKQQLFSALEKEGKSWDAEKKAIMDLKPKCEFKPFDKVLSRRCSKDYWVLNFYSHKTDYYHVCIDGSSNLDCIPYNEETAHLLGTTDNWEGGKQ
jgi:hypothetical protein